jgi:hypothetical protein
MLWENKRKRRKRTVLRPEGLSFLNLLQFSVDILGEGVTILVLTTLKRAKKGTGEMDEKMGQRIMKSVGAKLQIFFSQEEREEILRRAEEAAKNKDDPWEAKLGVFSGAISEKKESLLGRFKDLSEERKEELRRSARNDFDCCLRSGCPSSRDDCFYGVLSRAFGREES